MDEREMLEKECEEAAEAEEIKGAVEAEEKAEAEDAATSEDTEVSSESAGGSEPAKDESRDMFGETPEERRKNDFKNRILPLILMGLIIVGYILYAYVLKDHISCAGAGDNGAKEKLHAEFVLTEFTNGTSEYTESSLLKESMSFFYTRTGVQPHVLDLTSDPVAYTADELKARAESYYTETFEDQAHFLVVFQAHSATSYDVAYYTGTDAATVIDAEAVSVFDGHLNEYFNDNTYAKDVISKSFENSITEIMGQSYQSTFIILVAIIAVMVYMVNNIVRTIKKKKADPEGFEQMLADQAAERYRKRHRDFFD